jgi:hypothetical protein
VVEANPGLLPLALTVPVAVILLTDQGGYPITGWYPAGLFLLAALAMAAVSLPARSRVPRLTAVAATGMYAYAAWSYLSITWAGQKGIAWEGANRTALYAVVFSLCALWPVRARTGAAVLGALSFGVAAIGLVELLSAAAASDPSSWFLYGRFAKPAGYVNSNVALWSMAFFPLVSLGAARAVPPAVRALALGAAVMLGELALMGQSRGWQFAAPVAALLFVGLARDRVRAALALGLVVLAGVLASGPVLHVYSAVEGGHAFQPAVRDARNAILLAAFLVAIAMVPIAMLDRRTRPSRRARRNASRGLAAAAAAAVLVAGLIVAQQGGLVHRVSHAWKDFTSSTYPTSTGGRFGGPLGSARYDVWRVAAHQFARRPLVGVGADNFQEDYLRLRHTPEEPLYPHSVLFRTLGQTGVIGFLLVATALGAALWAAARAIHRRQGLGSAAALGGTMAFVYWLVHGLGDWFWEYAGLGVLAFAMLGLAVSLQPREWPLGRVVAARRPLATGPAVLAGLAVGAVLLGLSLAAPWTSELYVQKAIDSWGAHPNTALADLRKASSLDPLGTRPKLVAGAIAQRLGRDSLARSEFRQALDRDPRDVYSLLQLGAMTSDRALLERAAALDPRDLLVRAVLQDVRRGRRVDVAAVNRTIVQQTRGRLSAR